MKDYSELSKWLQDDITKPAVIRNGDYADTIHLLKTKNEKEDVEVRRILRNNQWFRKNQR